MHTRLFSIGKSEYDSTKMEFSGDQVRATTVSRSDSILGFMAWRAKGFTVEKLRTLESLGT
jgi:hypothetical protein